MKRQKTIAILLILSILTILMSACANDEKSNEYVIGFAAPLTGPSAQDGYAALHGLEIAVKQCNDAGGINGVPVRIDAQDDQSDPKQAAIVANKFVEDKRILGVVGNYTSSCTLAGAPIFNQAGLTQITFSASAASVTDAGPYTFRTINTDEVGGNYAAKWAFDQYDVKKAAILYENTDFGVSLDEIFKEACDQNGVEVVAEESVFVKETVDFATQLTKIIASEPDVLFLGILYNETALFAKQASNMGYRVPMVSVEALYSNALIELGGEYVEEIVVSTTFTELNQDAIVQKFVSAFNESYGEPPSSFAAFAYDAGLVLLEGIKNAGPDREKINEYITNIRDLPGVTGMNTFDENGDVQKEPLMLVVKDGAWSIFES